VVIRHYVERRAGDFLEEEGCGMYKEEDRTFMLGMWIKKSLWV
jgi:hypothetical protein